MRDMERDGFVAEFADEVGLPIPLQTCWEDEIEHALQCRIRDRTDEVEAFLFAAADRS